MKSFSSLGNSPEEKIIANLVIKNGEWKLEDKMLENSQNPGESESTPQLTPVQRPRPPGSFGSRRRAKNPIRSGNAPEPMSASIPAPPPSDEVQGE
eukprot:CAMPEP_0117876530 /NCGR_PEP_ID=MMETSP0950-20121206/13620_1 /TAXON_ID=44440 /ORGANISM="Chattonella subsalsa, Strain CCMP2191" /LENGTH=95 /DNA_ID=CAMNT_0005730285 /DNA_START=151 /DNA_END=435 /DNA_ORIENTATION=-